MSEDNVTFITPQEKRLLSLEERLIHVEKQLRIILNLLSELAENVSDLRAKNRPKEF